MLTLAGRSAGASSWRTSCRPALLLSPVSIWPPAESATRLTYTGGAVGVVLTAGVFKNDTEATLDCNASGVPSPLPSPVLPPGVGGGTLFSMLAVAPSLSLRLTGPVPVRLTITPSGRLLRSTVPLPSLLMVSTSPGCRPLMSTFCWPVPVTLSVVSPVKPLVLTLPLPVLSSVTVPPGFVTLVSPLPVAVTVLPLPGFGMVVLPPGTVVMTVLVPSGLVMVVTGGGVGVGVGSGAGAGGGAAAVVKL